MRSALGDGTGSAASPPMARSCPMTSRESGVPVVTTGPSASGFGSLSKTASSAPSGSGLATIRKCSRAPALVLANTVLCRRRGDQADDVSCQGEVDW